jgi:hypothetical protein
LNLTFKFNVSAGAQPVHDVLAHPCAEKVDVEQLHCITFGIEVLQPVFVDLVPEYLKILLELAPCRVLKQLFEKINDRAPVDELFKLALPHKNKELSYVSFIA